VDGGLVGGVGGQLNSHPMAASLKLFPGSTVRWCGRRYIILDYAGLDAIKPPAENVVAE
jgi:hypothetical protein